ncbi:MAG: hypothetical protein ACRDPO_20275 [Streptosporangiaceae bacterium]
MTGADLTRLRRVVYDTLAAEGRALSLHDDFVPHAREHNQALPEASELTGPFWRLP